MAEPDRPLDLKSAFEILRFYEETAGKVKGRTWTISAWLLSANSALMGFCFSLPETAFLNRQNSIISAAVAGLVLSTVLALLILSQGIHLREYMDHQINVLRRSSLGDTIKFDICKGVIPWFCWWLFALAVSFGIAFLIVGVVAYLA